MKDERSDWAKPYKQSAGEASGKKTKSEKKRDESMSATA